MKKSVAIGVAIAAAALVGLFLFYKALYIGRPYGPYFFVASTAFLYSAFWGLSLMCKADARAKLKAEVKAEVIAEMKALSEASRQRISN